MKPTILFFTLLFSLSAELSANAQTPAPAKTASVSTLRTNRDSGAIPQTWMRKGSSA